MPSTKLIVITGCSGSGKTSLAQALQERLLPETWFHFSPDTILYCLPRTLVDRADLANDWSGIDTRLVGTLAEHCVRAALQAGAGVVFDCVVMTERRARQLLEAFAEAEPFLVGTTCAWDELVRRTATRGDRTLAEVRRGFETAGEFLEVDHRLDTTSRTPATLADELLRQLDLREVPSAWQRNRWRYAARSQR
jgi:chloramphenicol 3-O-phosphotransferase